METGKSTRASTTRLRYRANAKQFTVVSARVRGPKIRNRIPPNFPREIATYWSCRFHGRANKQSILPPIFARSRLLSSWFFPRLRLFSLVRLCRKNFTLSDEYFEDKKNHQIYSYDVKTLWNEIDVIQWSFFRVQ